jgi:hypothetical protein
MNARRLVEGVAALSFAALSIHASACVGQPESTLDESLGAAEQADQVTGTCPQAGRTALLATGSANGFFPANYDDACAGTASGLLDQYAGDGALILNPRRDLGVQCRDFCTDHGHSPDCGSGWRLDGYDSLRITAPLSLESGTLNPLRGEASTIQAPNQAVSCLDRVDPLGQPQHQWVALCTCGDGS